METSVNGFVIVNGFANQSCESQFVPILIFRLCIYVKLVSLTSPNLHCYYLRVAYQFNVNTKRVLMR